VLLGGFLTLLALTAAAPGQQAGEVVEDRVAACRALVLAASVPARAGGYRLAPA
jgi:hypothetical protein